MIQYLLLLVFPVAITIAAAFDLLTMTIPNKISLALAAAFLVVAPLTHLPLNDIGTHVATGLGVLVAGFVLFARGYVGGGDVKLLAATALWLGFDSLGEYIFVVCLFGGLLSVVVLMLRRLPDAFVPGPPWLVRLHSKDSGVPYGLAIGAGALMISPHTLWFTELFSQRISG